MNKLSILTIFACSLAAGVLSLSPVPAKYARAEALLPDTIRIAFAGDLMCHGPQMDFAKRGRDTFDFTQVYRFVRHYLLEADLAIANLETVTAGKEKGYSGYPFFNSPDAYLDGLAYAGFGFLVTANNHSLDRGAFGLVRTLEQLRIRGIGSTGTFVSEQDRDSIRIVTIKGVPIAIINYSYGTNGNPVPAGKKWLINIIDGDSIKNGITAARRHGAALVVVFFHFGTEYKRTPDAYQETAVKAAVAGGADLIIGSHPHVIQPMRFWAAGNGAAVDTVLVAYSLGNFISNQRWRYSDAGAILRVAITTSEEGKYKILPPEVIPTWVYKGTTTLGKEFIILPEGISPDKTPFLTAADSALFRQATADTRKWLIIN